MLGLIQTYLDHLTVERGMSRHTVAAYRRDLTRYAEYLSGLGVTDPELRAQHLDQITRFRRK